MSIATVTDRTRLELGELHVADTGDRYTLDTPLEVVVDGWRIIVPAGFVTDFSSVPRAFAWFVDFRKVDLAGVVHDYLYRYALLPRSHADRIWRILAGAGLDRALFHQRWIGWLALRVGGWAAWNGQPYSGPYRLNGRPRGEP